MRAYLVAFVAALLALAEPAPATGASERDRKQAQDRLRAAEKALEKNDTAEAERLYREATGKDPLLAPAHWGLARLEIARKRYPEALAALEACRKAFLDLEGLRLQGAKEADDRIEAELRSLRDALHAVSSGNVSVADATGETHRIEARIDELERAKLRDAGASAGPPAALLLSLGAVRFRLGQLPEAEREYRAALAVDPKLGEAHNNLAVLLFKTGRLDDAAAEIEAAKAAGFAVHPALEADVAKARAASAPATR